MNKTYGRLRDDLTVREVIDHFVDQDELSFLDVNTVIHQVKDSVEHEVKYPLSWYKETRKETEFINYVEAAENNQIVIRSNQAYILVEYIPKQVDCFLCTDIVTSKQYSFTNAMLTGYKAVKI